jgi:hypothetical protein
MRVVGVNDFFLFFSNHSPPNTEEKGYDKNIRFIGNENFFQQNKLFLSLRCCLAEAFSFFLGWQEGKLSLQMEIVGMGGKSSNRSTR